MPDRPICSIPGCAKPVSARGWCKMHHNRWLRHGDTGPAKPLKKRWPKGAQSAFMEKLIASDWPDECVAWPFARDGNGRGQVQFRGRCILAARAICILVHGEPPYARSEAAHNCGKGHEGCVNPGHIEWKTVSGNQRDRIRHGTSNRGERQGGSKLTSESVREIRQAYRNGTSVPDLARDYAVGLGTVYDLLNRRTWAWLD